jgi:murein DD-endopeptidase MepM/ murein hydrolase activator NlpD
MLKKFLYHPVSPFKINQGFGADTVCISTIDNKTLVRKETNASCPANFRSLYTQTNGHNGLDLFAYRWQPCYATHSGIVTEVQTEEARGLGIGIVTDRKWFCQETGKDEHFKTRYWHFIALNIHRGDKVKTGDLIGWCDSTGYSTGDHLHFELKPVTIISYEEGVPVYNNTLQNNGMLGAVNPLPYFENVSALQIAGIVRQIAELTARVADYFSDLLRR